MNLELISDRCTQECIRQQVGLTELANLIKCYHQALDEVRHVPDRLPNEFTVRGMAVIIEPVKAQHYRRTPVTFANGATAMESSLISNAMRVLFDFVQSGVDHLGVDYIVKEFLDIHPFEDGNGRTAFVLYNWLNKTLENPVPLPDYYKEG